MTAARIFGGVVLTRCNKPWPRCCRVRYAGEVSATHHATLPSTDRWVALDVFRGVAVVSMIQGHTFTALMRPSEYGKSWESWYRLAHGLTAPMFLLGGGLTYGIVTLKNDAVTDTADSSATRKRLLTRALSLITLGYVLQLPKTAFAELLARSDLLAVATRVGPLQLVGVCLLICEGLRSATRTRKGFLWGAALLGTAIAGCAPLLWNARLSSHIAVPVGTWFDGYAGSDFPFFPWAVFFFIGTITSAPLLRMLSSKRRRRRERQVGSALIVLGLLSASLMYGLFVHGYVLRNVYGNYELWHTSPLFVIFRAALVLVVLGTLCLLEPLVLRVFRRAKWLATLFTALSKQSLVAYVTHLLVLYGSPFTIGLVFFGMTLGLGEASTVFAGVLAFTTAIALLWSEYVAKRGRALLASALRVGARAQGRDADGVGERKRLDVGAVE